MMITSVEVYTGMQVLKVVEFQGHNKFIRIKL